MGERVFLVTLVIKGKDVLSKEEQFIVRAENGTIAIKKAIERYFHFFAKDGDSLIDYWTNWIEGDVFRLIH